MAKESARASERASERARERERERERQTDRRDRTAKGQIYLDEKTQWKKQSKPHVETTSMLQQ